MSAKSLATGGSAGILFTDRREFYYKPNEFAELFPSVAPFLTFVMNSKVKTGLADPVFKLFQHKAPWERQYMAVNMVTPPTIAAASNGAAAESSAVTFDTITGLNSSIDASYEGLQFEVWDSGFTTYRGTVICTAATSSTDAKFKNLGTSAITLADNDNFVLVGQASEEGSLSPEAWADDLQVVWNQCQIFRTPVEITGTLKQAVLRGARDELARLRADKAAEHKIRMEKAFLWGLSPLGTNLTGSDSFANADKLVKTAGGNPIRTTTGLGKAIQLYGASSGQHKSYFVTSMSSYTYDKFVDDMEIVFQYVPTSGVKTAFIGAKALSFFAKKAMDKNSGWVLNQDSSIDQRGNKVRYLVTPHGDIELKLTHSFKYEHAYDMLLPDSRNLEYVEYRPTQYVSNIKTDNNYDGVKDEWFSDAGLGITNIESQKLFRLVA